MKIEKERDSVSDTECRGEVNGRKKELGEKESAGGIESVLLSTKHVPFQRAAEK